MNDDPSRGQPGQNGGVGDAGTLMVFLRRILPGRRRSDDPVRDAIEELMEECDDSTSMSTHERSLLENVLHLRDVTASDVMIPRADILAVEVETPLAEAVDLVAQCGHSRLPVFHATLDDVIGMVHIKDVLPAVSKGRDVSLRRLTRRVLFISPAMRALDLLLDMRLKRTHMALVVDEYGGIDGLVTIEDLIEQIVGDIEDEHETDSEPEMIVGADGTLVSDARVTLEDFENRFGSCFDEDEKDYTDTLGGLVFRMIGRVPVRGEVVSHLSGLDFEVLDADPRRIRRLRIRNISLHDGGSSPDGLPPSEGGQTGPLSDATALKE